MISAIFAPVWGSWAQGSYTLRVALMERLVGLVILGWILFWGSSCTIDRDGTADVGSGFDAGMSGRCRPGTVDANSNPSDGCECVLAPAPVEICNGADDDCNGVTDEGLVETCGGPPGSCNAGTRSCDEGTWSDCVPTVASTTETCSGGDDDCDGSVDEGCDCSPGATMPCGFDVGACVAGTQECGGDDTWGSCQGGIGPTTESCNGVDDDCDGVVDAIERPCGDSMGICTMGVETCTGGDWGECTGGVSAKVEACDADMLDEDCDGSVNEGCRCYEGETRTCNTGMCSGTETCGDTGRWGACLRPAASVETCNGIDDDCNGLVDDEAGDCAIASSCSVERDGSTTYLFCESSTNWPTAKERCERLGYHLIVISNILEQSFVQGLSGTYSSTQWWIGLSDQNGDGNYQNSEWVEGSPSYRNWEADEPNQTTGCVILSSNESGLWSDRMCSGNESFICESP